MRTKELSSGVLVYDRYYTAKPHAVLLTLKKTLICCALAVFSMMYIFVEYEFDISLLKGLRVCKIPHSSDIM